MGTRYDPFRYGLKPTTYRVQHFGHSTQCRTRNAMVRSRHNGFLAQSIGVRAFEHREIRGGNLSRPRLTLRYSFPSVQSAGACQTLTKWRPTHWTFADLAPTALDVCGPHYSSLFRIPELGPKTSKMCNEVRYHRRAVGAPRSRN
jgi:hypothetical protein